MEDVNKSDLVERLSDRAKLPLRQAEAVVDLVFETMAAALTREERIEIRGFGSFVVRHYKEYRGRNPRTGESIPVKPKRLPYFKVGKELKKLVDQSS